MGMRWSRSQRFTLSAKGVEAEARYRQMIVDARSVAGRPSFDAARAAWAASLPRVQPDDGLYLGELQRGPRTLEEVVRAVESCGPPRSEVKAAIERLADSGMIEALPLPVS